MQTLTLKNIHLKFQFKKLKVQEFHTWLNVRAESSKFQKVFKGFQCPEERINEETNVK